MTRQYEIPKRLIEEGWKQVKSNQGAAGVDGQSIEDFEKDLDGNLYKIWNRMTSGSYFPPAVRAVPIPKKTGGTRILGVPCVSDRVAQTVTKMYLEPRVEKVFHPDSFGYRPGRSQHHALAIARKRCWKYDWVIEIDIKGYFDNISHKLVLDLVRKYADEKWIHIYVERWLTAKLQHTDGSQEQRDKGSPQGSVISPVLSNIFLHHAFDHWMQTTNVNAPFVRYADDILIHCKTLDEAIQLRHAVQSRLHEWGLELNETKSRIVYCKDSNRSGEYEPHEFTFLGYTFRPRRSVNNLTKQVFTSFLPALSSEACSEFTERIHDWNLGRATGKTIDLIATEINAIVRGKLNYYGKFYPSALHDVLHQIDVHLIHWALRKYKHLKRSHIRGRRWLDGVQLRQPKLFAHWQWRLRFAE
jgi:RNA-directed DNA polymerase